jgi:hypothetical protein
MRYHLYGALTSTDFRGEKKNNLKENHLDSEQLQIDRALRAYTV